MLRIIHRSLVLVVCAVMLMGLIATRPAATQPPSTAAPRSAPILAAPLSPVTAHAAELAPPAVLRPARLSRAQIRRGEADDLAASLRAPEAIAVYRAEEVAAPIQRTLPPARIAGNGPLLRGQIVGQTARLDLYVGKSTFSPDQIAALAPRVELALRTAERRFGTRLRHRVSVGFYRTPPQKGVRGMAYTDEARAELFYRPGEDLGRALTIVEHELAHHLQAQRYGEDVQRHADTILIEGMATWIAGDRWLPMCGASSWRERAQQLRNAGIPLRLLTAERSGANNAYELWASFVDFLARRYGWEKIDALYRSSGGRAPGSANYQRVLGKSLDELADEWREWVTR